MLRCALPDRPLFYCYSGTSLQAEKLFELIKPVMLSLSKHLYRFVAPAQAKR